MSDLIGRTIGEYQLVQLVAEYEDSLLIKGFQPSMDRYVGVTLLKPHAVRDPSIVGRFLKAAEIQAQMQHVNILPVYEYGQEEDLVYSVSPFEEMGTVRDNLNLFRDLNNAATLVGQITDGLEYIYSQGFIHANLKSSNTFLDVHRRPLLNDFGMSRPAGRTTDPYVSPEQVQGDMVDQRTDVYALGVLLYELLTGAAPPALVVAKPSARRPDLSDDIDRVVLKAMSQNPETRFSSPAEFRDEFKNAVQKTLPSAVEPAATPEPTPAVSQSVNVQQPKGTNWAAIILSVILIAVLIGAAAIIIPGLSGDDEVAEVPTQLPVEPTIEPPVEQPPVVEPTEPPTDDPDGPGLELPEGLPDFCYSIGFAAGIAVFGITIAAKKHKREIFYDD